MSNDTHLLAEKQRILAALLPNVPFDGWTDTALQQAARDAGLDAGLVARAFPGGAIEAVEFWIGATDRAMIEALDAEDLAVLKVRDRIALAITLRLQAVEPHREAVRRALALQALPQHAPGALQSLYRTVDAIWHAVGDTAVDFNFYTKRLLLAGVYSSTLLYWLNDKSEGQSATWAFLDQRIDNVMQIQKLRGRFDKLAEKLPDPFNLLRRRGA